MSEEPRFTHLDAEGRARMVDVGQKDRTARRAVARARVAMAPTTLAAIRDGRVAKGAVLATARLAGIMAAKRTGDLIPLCHPLPLTSVSVEFRFASETELEIEAEARCVDRTGVEMEAMIAVSVAALTVYDMCKAADRGMEIRETVLVHKSGGKSGEWNRGD
ncbi:MAG: cyclic pyranopterin monophosphate synthase MoaC [Planctomycetota bacterium]